MGQHDGQKEVFSHHVDLKRRVHADHRCVASGQWSTSRLYVRQLSTLGVRDFIVHLCVAGDATRAGRMFPLDILPNGWRDF